MAQNEPVREGAKLNPDKKPETKVIVQKPVVVKPTPKKK